MKKIKKYKELRKGDIIWWYGGKVKIEEIWIDGKGSYYKDENVIRFRVRPADDECIKTLGNFYANGTYGGIEHLEAVIADE